MAIAACFSPDQEEKALVTYDDRPLPDAGLVDMSTSDSVGDDVDGATARDAAATAAQMDAALSGSLDGAPASVVPDGPDSGDSEDAPPAVLLFPSDCRAPWEDPTKYHPAGYDAHEVHGLESNLNKDDCTSCHGDKLEGCANSPSCDNCHDGGHRDGWRKDCIYCHGGDENMLGAPPRDMDGVSTKTKLTFIPHTDHVTKTIHAAFNCDTCHKNYQDALEPGHMYDDTPGKAEVTLSAGLSKDGKYDGNGHCSNLYCHGDGITPNKSIAHTDPKLTCAGCHSDTPVTGSHIFHTIGFSCDECHSPSVNDSMVIVGPDNHVNGKVDLLMPDNNMQWNGMTCTGTCHVIVAHDNDTW
ncbi:MAG TPA: hypothetical protein VG963_04760 [Polyangiaceae bacterium]|nr:hypothetical protein [Polyangiaceae bacterium]